MKDSNSSTRLAPSTGRTVPWRCLVGLGLVAAFSLSPAQAADRETSSSPFLYGNWLRSANSDYLPGYATYSDALEGRETYYEESAPPASPLVRVQHDPEESVGPMNVIGRFSLTSTEEAPNDPVPDEADPDTPAAPLSDSPDGELKFGEPPPDNSLQFLRTQDVLLAQGKWQADMGFVYTNFDTTSPAALVNGGGTVVGVANGDVRRRLMYSPFAARYGLTKNIQIFGVLPVGFSNTQISIAGISSNNTNAFGLGDFTGGASFHLLEACGDCPDVILTLGFTAPSGRFSPPLFSVVPGTNLGQGFWAAQSNLLFVNRYDPIIVFYGLGYRHLFQRDFGGISFQAGEQLSYQLGVGFSVNDRVTLSTALLGFYISQAKQAGSTIPGSNLEPVSLRFAATISRRGHLLEPFAIIGATQAAPAFSLGVVFTYY